MTNRRRFKSGMRHHRHSLSFILRRALLPMMISDLYTPLPITRVFERKQRQYARAWEEVSRLAEEATS